MHDDASERARRDLPSAEATRHVDAPADALASGGWFSADRTIRLELDVSDRAGAAARRALLTDLDATLTADERDTLDVLVSELVSNAVLHAGLAPGERIVVHAARTPQRIRVEVHDCGRGFTPELPPHPLGAKGGWGLYILDQMVSRWGVTSDAGAHVWFELDRAEEDRLWRTKAH